MSSLLQQSVQPLPNKASHYVGSVCNNTVTDSKEEWKLNIFSENLIVPQQARMHHLGRVIVTSGKNQGAQSWVSCLKKQSFLNHEDGIFDKHSS